MFHRNPGDPVKRRPLHRHDQLTTESVHDETETVQHVAQILPVALLLAGFRIAGPTG